MNNLDEKLLQQLNNEQGKIITSSSDRIIVSAGPGSGKTYTLVKKISDYLSSLPDYRGVVACSFTKEASKQLHLKIENSCDIKSSFIGTIDSFILTAIIDKFKNRYLFERGFTTNLSKLDISMPEQKSLCSTLTKLGYTNGSENDINNYCSDWVNNLARGIYEISFPAYLVGAWMITHMSQVSEYLTNVFSALFIDEAQDLNEFQHFFIEKLVTTCSMKCVMIGDKNQSIYEFRGARPEQFYSLRDRGYVEYSITVSVRCHKSILDFSNVVVDSRFIPTKNDDVRVHLGTGPKPDFLSTIDEHFFILCESNAFARIVYESLSSHNIDVIYSLQIEISDKEFKDNYLDLIEETIKFFINSKNVEPSLTYSIDEYIAYLSNYILEKNISVKKLSKVEIPLMDYLCMVLSWLNVIMPKTIYDELTTQLTNDVYLNHYKSYSQKNRVMTIHASKGLESESVFVLLEYNQYVLSDEYKRKLFVAFSRAKNHLFIAYKKNAIPENCTVDSFLKNAISRL